MSHSSSRKLDMSLHPIGTIDKQTKKILSLILGQTFVSMLGGNFIDFSSFFSLL